MSKNYIEYNNMVNLRDKNGFFQLENDKKAIQLFNEEIREKSVKFSTNQEKLKYLIENKYYLNFYEKFLRKEIEEFYQYAYSFNFEFKSFMAISKFYESYAVRTRDNKNFLESYEDRIVCVSMSLADTKQDVLNLIEAMMTQQYQPATPTFLNSGIYNSGKLVSCFLLDVDDSLNSISYNITTSMQLSKIGGGVALNLSKLRARGEDVKGQKAASKGVVPVLKILEDTFSYVDQLGKRPGAGAAYLSIFHADIIEFLDTKKINADEKSRIQSLSLGLIIPDKFMELARLNQDVSLFYPANIKQHYGMSIDEIDYNKMYDEIDANPQIKKKKIKARELFQMIAITQFESGYPYLVFIDNANHQNPLKKSGKILMSNLCTEIFQNQKTSEINDYYEEDKILEDVSCNLGSLNLVNFVESNNYEKTIITSIKALSKVSETSYIENAPGINNGNERYHAIGLGVMNLHGLLTKNKISYESKEALEIVDLLFTIINYYTIKASMILSKEKESKFYKFEQSEYATGKYFEKYIKKEFSIQYKKTTEIIDEKYIPTIKDWKELMINVNKYGMYNAYRLAIAPTQSISYIQNSTASVMPVVSQIERRMYNTSNTLYPMPFLAQDNWIYYKSAYDMDQLKIIDMMSIIQKHVDQGISTVIHVTNQHSTKDLVKYYYYAWKKGLKSIYYVRTKNLTIDECESCSI